MISWHIQKQQQTGGEKEATLCPHYSLHKKLFTQIRNVKTISIESLEIKGVYMSPPVFTSRLIIWLQGGFSLFFFFLDLACNQSHNFTNSNFCDVIFPYPSLGLGRCILSTTNKLHFI